MSFTLDAQTPAPFVHLDNRGLVLSSGGRCAALTGASLLRGALREAFPRRR